MDTILNDSTTWGPEADRVNSNFAETNGNDAMLLKQYNSDWNFISAVSTTDAPSDTTTNNVWRPKSAGTYTNFDSVVATANYKNEVIVKTSTGYNVETIDSSRQVEKSKSISINDRITLPFINAGYYDKNGVVQSSAGWYHTDITAIPSGSAIYVKNPFGDYAASPSVALFDNSDTYLGYRTIESGKEEEIFNEFGGATKYAISYTQTRIQLGFDCRVGVLLSTITSSDNIENQIITSENEVRLYPENLDGWYRDTGALQSQSGFIYSDKAALPEMIIVYAKYVGDSSYCQIIYFDDSDNVMGYEKLSSTATNYEWFYYSKFPTGATKYAVSIRSTIEQAYYSDKQTIQNEVKNLKRKEDVINYVPNYLLLNRINGGISEGITGFKMSLWTIEKGTDFIANGYKRYLQRIETAASNREVITIQAGDLSSDFYNNKIINVRFLIKSSVSHTLKCQIFQKSDTFSYIVEKIVSITANKLTEIQFNTTVSDTYLDNGFISLSLYFISLAVGTHKITGVHIWDGDVDFARISPALSRNDQLAVQGGYHTLERMDIGDSISQRNDFIWQGYMEQFFTQPYTREITGATKPAIGGTRLWPPVSETPGAESIWYRISSNMGLTAYSPNLINLFGGQNDLNKGDFDLGTAADTPYLDTDSRPSPLTWASAFKGCIEMIQRDFPEIELVTSTIYPTSTGVADSWSLSKQMANLVLEISQDYGIKCFDFWNLSGINTDNYLIYTVDGVHPNDAGARRLIKVIQETLLL